LPGEASVERWAAAIGAALEVLVSNPVAVVGHHTGGAIAIELAHQRPEQVAALVLSSTHLCDAEYRSWRSDAAGLDAADDPDGLRLFRARFYPPDQPELLDRFVTDALRAGPLAHAGHEIVGAYEMDGKLELLRMPVLLIGADRDPYAYPHLERLERALPHAQTSVIAGGMVPLPDGWPEQFAETVADFLGAVL
jgi:pimeloyl-ACP methyl ester carboxylesterase